MSWLRRVFAESEGRAAPLYGLATAVGVVAPLVAGALTGHAADSVPAGLGAFYVAFAGPRGPYGARARSMLVAVAVVTVFTWFGGLLAGRPVLATLLVPIVAAAGAALPWPGPTAALCTLVAAVRPPTSPVLVNGVLEAAGGLWVSVLLLAPWVIDRLRPLRGTLAEAVRAVADAGEAPPEEWGERRKSAYDALSDARSTCALYRRPGEPERDRPALFAEALGRAMGAIVASRSLHAALGREAPPPDEWQEEWRAVMAALARWLRGLARAVEARRTPPPRPAAELEAFVRACEQVRWEHVESRHDIIGAALVLQVRRSVERIADAIEDAAAIAARGLQAGFDLPFAGGRPWHAQLTTGSPGLRHAARVGVAIVVAMALQNGLHLPFGYWLPITVMFCLRDSYGGTVERAAKRVAGATVGGTGAAVALAIAPGQTTLMILVFAGAAAGFTLQPVNHAWWITFATPLIMLLIDFTRPLTWQAAGWRIGLTLAGAALALAAARALWPTGALRTVPERLARLLHAHADLARTVAALFEGRPDAPIDDRLREAASAAREVEETAVRLAQEPAPPAEPLHGLREATATARRLRDYVATLAALIQERPVYAGPIPAILRRVADHLDAEADTDALDLDDLLGKLDEHLSRLCRRRRAEIAGGARIDAVTSLREALIEVAGARHAVRALAEDAHRLAEQGRALIV
ncbi:FUSC family protein [Actinoallomurus sp. NBC_01490]|uniref:FUSC family protein n=1 Tax=Actinoallomurus sp. NBC_01490 TaxID=2903557 RepID=UPI002E2EEA0D|nr:FUSC family protein [Actinoallomurus sp. NBC_01490]